MILLAVMLFSASVAGWLAATDASAAVRNYVRFACVLYAALAVSAAVDPRLSDSVTLIVAAVAPALLAVAVRASVSGSISTSVAISALALSTICGMIAAVTGLAVFAFAPLTTAVLAIIAMNLARFSERRVQALQSMASAIAMMAGASVFMVGAPAARTGFMLLHAAGLLGIALALAPRSETIVEEKRVPDLRSAAIRGPR